MCPVIRKAIFPALFCIIAIAAYAQQGAAPKYDRQKEEKVTGTVDQLSEYHCPVSGTLGSHFTLKDGNGVLFEVHLAPVKFMHEYGITVTQGEKAEVIGMKAEVNGKPAILAKSLKVGQSMYTFRDDEGRPLW